MEHKDFIMWLGMFIFLSSITTMLTSVFLESIQVDFHPGPVCVYSAIICAIPSIKFSK